MLQHLDIGNEALGYQGKDFFIALQYIIQKARDSKEDSKAVLNNLAIDIDKTIAEYVNASNYTRWSEQVQGGYVSMRVNTRQHASFLAERGQQEENFFHNNRDIATAVTQIGFIDAAKGKLGGSYGKNRTYMTLNPKHILGWPVEEAAAVIIHECGHIYANAFYDGVFYVRNMAMDWMYKEMIKTSDAVKVKKIITVTRQTMGLQPNQVVTEINEGGEKAFIIAATEITKDMIDDDPLEAFTYDAAEQMADAFAIRHGAGKTLMTSRLRSYIDARTTAYSSIATACKASFCAATFSMLLPPVFLISIYYMAKALTLLGFKIYDNKTPTVQQVFGNIQKEMIQCLKEAKLDKEHKDILIEDIEEGFIIIEQAKKNEFDLARSMWRFMSDIFTDKNVINDFNERLQGLGANRLFVDAAKLSKSI